MKKLTLVLSIAINLSFILYACTKADLKQMNPESSNNDLRNGRSRYTSNAALNGNTPMCTSPFEGMRYSDVVKLIGNYRDNQHKAIRDQLGFTDATACWFSLESLKNFICHLESQATMNGCANLNNFGIRFYYGAHNAEPPLLAGIPENYAGLHNLVLIPTYRDDKGNNVDFDPSHIDKNTCKPIPLTLNSNWRIRNILTAEPNGASDSAIFAMDHGQLGPPDYNGMIFYP